MIHVTQVLSNCGIRGDWPKHFSKEDQEFYLRRGSMIHLATDLYDKDKLDWATLDERIVPYIEAWKKFRLEMGGKVLASELPVKNKKYNYQGKLDRIISKCALYPTGLLLIDIKTTAIDIATRLQTMAYMMAQNRKAKRGAVALQSDGNYKVQIFEDDASDKVGWIACLQLNNWIERNTK